MWSVINVPVLHSMSMLILLCLCGRAWSKVISNHCMMEKIYILMLMKCISLSRQTFTLATKCNFNFARSPTSNFSEFALWNSWCVRSKSHVFFSIFGLVASKTCTSPLIFKTYCNAPLFLQCECLAYIWGGWGVKMSTEFKFWNNYLFRQLLF